MSDAEALLALQDIDTRLDQLRHRRATLPEVDELSSVEAELASLASADRSDQDALGVLATEQRRLEDEVAALSDKITREQERQSTIIVPREAEAVEAELASLRRRRTELEDRILELMEAAEPLDGTVEERAAVVASTTGRRDELAAQVAEAQHGLDTEIDGLVAERGRTLAAVTAASLLGQYDRLRERIGGVVVGTLDGSMCTACSLQLPPVEVERLREAEPGSVGPCDCGRLIAVL